MWGPHVMMQQLVRQLTQQNQRKRDEINLSCMWNFYFNKSRGNF